jgi:alpha-tubulin suppressor-like RCC1 family protein
VAFCWGANSQGQLGDGTYTDRTMPVRVAGGLRWRQLSSGASHTCGVTTDTRAYCWGNNGNGQIGDGTHGNVVLRPSAVAGGLLFRQIDAGYAHTCGVTTGDRAFCWGGNYDGELGDGTTTITRLTPTALAVDLLLGQVSAGTGQSCAVTTDDGVYCWGDNAYGQLGDGTTTDRHAPVPVLGP